jgi:hypothetical protein
MEQEEQVSRFPFVALKRSLLDVFLAHDGEGLSAFKPVGMKVRGGADALIILTSIM